MKTCALKVNFPSDLGELRPIEKSFEDMLSNLEKVFDRLQKAGLKLKANKCNLCAT
jgi:hypothetical protein